MIYYCNHLTKYKIFKSTLKDLYKSKMDIRKIFSNFDFNHMRRVTNNTHSKFMKKKEPLKRIPEDTSERTPSIPENGRSSTGSQRRSTHINKSFFTVNKKK